MQIRDLGMSQMSHGGGRNVRTAKMRRRRRGDWQVELTALVKRLRHLLGWMQKQTPVSDPQDLINVISSNLEAAEDQLSRRPSASSFAVILAHLDSAQTDLLRLAPASY